ncbi:MAG: hypothetical protein WAX14_02525 [Rhodococcus sp. (in: high G+C Gram-positive bacteria)]|uniref:hypothetical protein n=1 Tax=Rhodococcus sp. TaxID=1831 RepID=UPI003BB5F36A
MNRHRMNHRNRTQFEKLLRITAPGCVPWLVTETPCPSRKRRWETEHAADVALRDARQLRLRRGRGIHRGKLETRAYACEMCDGFHLTSMTSDEYEARFEMR